MIRKRSTKEAIFLMKETFLAHHHLTISIYESIKLFSVVTENVFKRFSPSTKQLANQF